MKTARTHQSILMRSRSLIFIAVLVVVGAIAAVPFYSALSNSLPSSLRVGSSVVALKTGPFANRGKASPRLNSLVEPQPFAEGVATFNSDCVTPQTDFNLGDTVCAKASGVPVTLFPWRVLWVDPKGLIRQANVASSDDTTTYIYQLPSTPTSNVDGITVDNRGNWSVKLARSNGVIRQSATFVVHEPANPVADVFVQKFIHSGNTSVASGDNISFIVVVGNAGPDPAADVHLVDSVPAGGTLVQFTQNSGPACVPGTSGPANDCTFATLNNGDRAEFTVIYNTGAAAAGDYQTSATVSTSTNDPDSDNNTFAASYSVTAGGGGSTCQLICPDNITTSANTTEASQRGAHVTFDSAITSGDCGSVTATPASGSFFPVGTTTVNVTSETGGGSCSFTVTVEDHGGTASITCPDNITASADANCVASVSPGTPISSGDNITLFATRSDGQPMYDCDANGNCTRRSTDAPFPAGTTTITWFAYAHDVAGPYTTPGPNCPGPDCQGDTFEEQHRTSNASCTQTVTVNDVTPPVIGATSSQVSADANCQAVVPDYSTTVTDNCACDSSDSTEACVGHPHVVVTQDPAPGTVVGLGSYTIHITANDGSSNNDGAGNTSTKDITLTVADTTPPTFTFVPGSITAYTGPGATTCDAVVDPGQATASDNCGTPTVTRSPSGNTFPVGTTTVTWTATDGAGNSTTATQTITVIDNTVPVITLNGNTPSMWPPNHKYQSFNVTDFVSSVFDNCGGVSVSDVVISQVTSDEAENGNGSGNTVNDIVIGSDCKSVQLRAERNGGGDGRVYTITFRLVDTHGNTTTTTARVVVAHNPGETPVDSGVHYTVYGNCP